MTVRATALLALVALGCGGEDRRAAPPPQAVLPTTAVAQPASAEDPVVATVSGQPVYGSCVEMQAEALGLDVRAALDQCIGFELLAQEAERRGLRGDPDVSDAWRREMVRRLIAADLGAITSLDQLPAGFREAMMSKFGQYLQRPFLRGVHYAGVVVPGGAIKGGPQDLAARAVAEAIYQELAGEEGVLPDELFAVGDRLAGAAGLAITRTRKPFFTAETEVPGIRGTYPDFRDAVVAIPEIGRVGRPARTKDSWDVPLYWTFMPAEDLTPGFFLDARRQYFVQWSEEIRARLGLERWIDGEVLAGLAEDGEVAP